MLHAQIYPVNAALETEKSFSMILLPDPQSYTKFAANQPIFDLMTRWAANNLEKLSVKAVLCTGDLVEQNEWPVPDKVNGDQTSTQQWEAAARASTASTTGYHISSAPETTTMAMKRQKTAYATFLNISRLRKTHAGKTA